MKWDNIKEYKRTLEYSYEPYNNQQLDYKPRIPRIPPIIDPKKTYNCFTVECDCSEKIIITEDTSAGKICKITLNYNYYTANEIFDIFKIPKIRSYNQVGHIIHLNLDDLHQEYKNIIGNIILSKTNAKTVIQKIKLNEIMRNVECEVLAGDENLETWHNENGFRFFVDYGNVYWNSKLANERNNLKLTGTVVDPFCGCGAFVLYALKNNCKVYCNDLNPVAIKCLEVNVKTYKKRYGTIDGDNVDCVGSNMDAEVFLNGIDFHVDHFLFNLPEYSLDYVKCLQRFTGFILHCYFFAHNMQNAIDLCNEKCFMPVTKNDLKFIRKVSPSKDMYKLTIKRE